MTETPATSLSQKPDHRRWLLWTLRAVPGILLLVFIVMNRDPVRVKFILWDIQTSLIWALVTAAGLGFALGFFAHRFNKK